jgi:class 3 adenylate cyclase
MSIEIANWLRGLGLEQYAAAFDKNAIDVEILGDLTADDLKELGVDLVGHRRKLLAAIAGMRSTKSKGPADDGAAVDVGSAERRQLTVMFCDLVGSTALAAQLDPEDLREVIGSYQAAVTDEVGQLGGFVAKYMGDGILIYFGYPHAHEEDAERALRAGLALVERIGRLEWRGTKLAIRVGIATGVVVVGDLIGRGSAQERGVTGETSNLAARLQAVAEPNRVLIADATRRMVGDLFEYRDLGAVELKGLPEAVPVWQVLRHKEVESRFEAFHPSVLTPLVAREEELELLARRWQRAKAGDGQIVLMSGEPGIGKSRLAIALQDSLREEPHTRLRYFCSPHHQNSTLYPFITRLERAAGFERDDPPAIRLDKLAALLATAGEVTPETTALFVDLLGLENDGHCAPAPQDSQRKREMTLVALLGQLEALARQRPVLMVFEDAHWADATSLELLDRMVARLARLPVLLLVTFRRSLERRGWLRRMSYHCH